MKHQILIFILVLILSSLTKLNAITVQGKVIDNEGNPLPGVNISVINEKSGAVSDLNGKFSINVNNENSILQFTFVGFITEKRKAGKEQNITVILLEDTKTLEEVVVIGYGTASRESVSSAVSKVNTGNVAEKGFSNLQQMLIGAASGVQVSTVSGQPGAAMNIEIRGINSISGSTQPLYVIDGVPMDDENAMLNINPNDIQSMNVLKDASSAAIYGSRGNNGVILITTKQGREGRTKVDASYTQKLSSFYRFLPMINGPEYGALQNEMRIFRGYNGAYQDNIINDLPTFDHTKLIMQLGQSRDANISISGGDKKTKYYVSGQYLNDEGIIVKTDLKRMGLKATFERELIDKLSLTSQINYSNSIQNGNVTSGLTGVVSSALRWAPTSPLMNQDGSYNVIPGYMYGTDAVYTHPIYGDIYVGKDGTGKVWAQQSVFQQLDNVGAVLNNPLAVLKEQVMRTTRDNFMTNMTMRYKLSSEINLLGRFAYTLNNTLEDRYQPTSVKTSTQWTGSASQIYNRNIKTLYEFTANYDKAIKRHKLNLILSTSAERYLERGNTFTTRDFVQDQTQMYDMSAGSIFVKPISLYNSYQLVSFVSRAIYSYNYKYFLTLSSRLDGSSRFARGNRWGLFPTMSASWIVNKEDFLKKIKEINLLKIRGGFGISGGQAISSYSTMSLLESNYTAFGNTLNIGYSRSFLENPDLTWEKNKQTNLGLDLTLLKNLITINIDAYYKLTDNLLMRVQVPSSSGFDEMWDNVGSIENKGLEFNLNLMPINTKTLQWNINGNISFNRNQVRSLNISDEGYVAVGSKDISGAYLSRLVEGRSISDFYGLRLLGIYNPTTIAEKPVSFNPSAIVGNRRYEDINNDQMLDLNDRVVIGSALPLFTGGFGTSLTYKDFEIQANFVYSYGNSVYNQVRMALEWQYAPSYYERYQQITPVLGSNGKPLSNQPEMTYEEKLKILYNNDQTKVRMLGTSESDWFNDFGVEDGSFLRCREVYASYNMPVTILKKIKLSGAKVYSSVTNPFIITSYTGYNPEVGSGAGLVRGYDTGAYPLARTFSIGLIVNL
jgi:TonB-linked SusC/RagA family outer membrane protein